MTTTITGIAGEDLSSSRYLLIKIDGTAEKFKVATAADANDILGVLQNQPVSGKEAVVVIHGLTKVTAGAGVIEPFDFVMWGTGGKVILYTPSTSNICIGRYVPRVIDTNGTLSYVDAAAGDDIDVYVNIRGTVA